MNYITITKSIIYLSNKKWPMKVHENKRKSFIRNSRGVFNIKGTLLIHEVGVCFTGLYLDLWSIKLCWKLECIKGIDSMCYLFGTSIIS